MRRRRIATRVVAAMAAMALAGAPLYAVADEAASGMTPEAEATALAGGEGSVGPVGEGLPAEEAPEAADEAGDPAGDEGTEDEPATGEAGAPAEGEGAADVPVTGEADVAGEPDVPEGSQEVVDSSEVPASGEGVEGEDAGDAVPVDEAETESAGNTATDPVSADSASNGLPSEAAPVEETTPLAEDDTEAPTMEGALSVSTKSATAGDTVTFTLRASDVGTGLDSVGLNLLNLDTGDTDYVSAQAWRGDIAGDGTATATLEIEDARHASGRWAVRCVSLSDARGNSVGYYDPRFATDWELENCPTADLSALDFEVCGTTGDTEAPTLIGAVGVTVRQVMPGESVTMMLRTEGHDVSRAWITYRTPETGSEHDVELDRRTADGIMSGTMDITPQTEVGVWEALSVNVVDSNGAQKSVTNSALGARAMALSAEEASARSGDDILSRDSADLSALTFEVTPFESQVAGQFWDTPADAWYVTEGWLDYVVSNGIISGYAYADGTPQGKFGPDDPLTRGQLAVILYRHAHPGSTDTVDPGDFASWSAFPDVPAGAYYTAAINWCRETGVITGYDSGPDAGRFLPDRAVTRAELATMVWRFAKNYLGIDVSGADPSAFESLPDHADIYPFAVEAMVWCADEGLMTGNILGGTAYLDAQGTATRAQAAKVVTVLVRDVAG